MKTYIRIKLLLVTFFLSLSVLASGGELHLDEAHTDISNTASLQNGAKLFMNYCSGCHAISFMRYNRIAKDLSLSDSAVAENLMFAGEKVGELITTAMPEDAASKWFGGVPPDLSLVARSKGTDWIYSYLRGFYPDDSKVFGVNNKVLANASMPDALWSLKENQSGAEFDQSVRDITNFLDYVGEPAKLIRTGLGAWVLSFLVLLFVLSYFLKKEYWKDVKYGIWRSRD
ncbi:MAG: cytochrome c1 [Candidatus Thioglobus sp.]|jgi:ubiquinol-cytochrome c reductase cytochrome c1 subunit|nr:cytochrome c1 [Candidatus Thioglobus sp.]|tara:strand:- start:52 stop:738 length:687 start_codon:yes stop_codon:yes gene_type:complete